MENILKSILENTVLEIQNDFTKPISKYSGTGLSQKNKSNSKGYTSNSIASGNLSRNTYSEVVQAEQGLVGRIWSLDYILYNSEGRGATKSGGNGSLKDRIRQWLEDKPVPLGDFPNRDVQAFAISGKIHRVGTNLDYSHALNRLNTVQDEAIKQLGNAYVTQVLKSI